MDQQIASAIRAILTVAGGSLVTRGYTDAAGLEAMIGGFLVLVGVLWSQKHHKQTKRIMRGKTKGLSDEEIVGQ